MPNPFAPLLGFVGLTAVGRRSRKRRRKKNKSEANGTSTQHTSSSRALDIIRIQRGLPRNDSSSQTADEGAEHGTNGQVRPSDVPPLRISKMLSSDTIGLTTDGRRGYVGPQWWARHGRTLLTSIRRRHPGATPEEALHLLLKQAAPSVDWESEDLPRGALMLSRRLRRLVEAAYMGREEAPSAPEVASPESPQEAPEGMPFTAPPEDIEGAPTPPVPSDIDTAPESPAPATEPGDEPEADASTSAEPEPVSEAQGGSQKGKTRRGGRRGGKKDRKAAAAAAEAAQEGARDTPEDGGEADGGGAPADSGASEADSPPSE